MFVLSRRRPGRPRVRFPRTIRRIWVRCFEDRIVPATYFVDRLDDVATPNPTDPFRGSLRYVVEQANDVPGCDDVIIIKMGTINILSPLEIRDEINIDPYGASESIIDFSKIDYSKNKSALIIDDCNPQTSMHVSFKAVSIVGGQAREGGVIFVENEDLILDKCVLSGNKATAGRGGAIYFAGGIGAKLTITDSTISGNTSTGSGGAVYVSGSVSVLIQNSTVSGNTAQGQGGGIAFSGDATLEIRNSTITKNNSSSSKGGGGIARINGLGIVSLSSAIIAKNSAPTAPDLAFDTNSIVNATNAIIGVADQGKFTISGSPNFVGTSLSPLDPLLGNLADNGGETQTHEPQAGSLAINNGNNSAGLNFDQRGPSFSRVLNGTADIGAFETSKVPYAKSKRSDVTTSGGTTFKVDVTYTDSQGGAIDVSTVDINDIIVTSPNGTVLMPSSVMLSAPTNGSPRTATYTFAASGGIWDAEDNGTYSVSLQSGQVFDTDGIPNAVPAGPLGDFLVSIPSTRVVNATNDEAIDTDTKTSLREAILSTPGGIITFDSTVFATPQSIKLVLGELVISSPVTIVGSGIARVTIDGQNLSRVVRIDGPGSKMEVALLNLTISNGNTGGQGGGILNVDEALRVTNCTVTNSFASGIGGGVAVGSNGSVYISQSVISGNTSQANAGGLAFASNGGFTLVDSALIGNIAQGAGGGFVLNTDATAQISNSTVSSNQATNGGGGGFLNNFGGSLLINNSTIANNQSTGSSIGGGIRANNAGPIGILTLQSTILATNFALGQANDLHFDSGTNNVPGNDNIVGVADVGNFTLTGTNNQTGTQSNPFNAQIGPLSLNGGPTPTHALLGTSPAINQGNTTTGGMIYDQRGPSFFRIRGGRADVGAFELQTGAAPPTIVSISINNGVLQRSVVTSIRVTFSEFVTFSSPIATAFELTRQSDGASVTLNSTDPTTTNVVTLTFTGGAVNFGSLADGLYNFVVIGAVISSANGKLDGDGNGYVSPCEKFILIGSTNPGPKLFRLFGDVNADGRVNTVDFAQFRSSFGLGSSAFDYDTDNDTDLGDFAQFRSRFGLAV